MKQGTGEAVGLTIDELADEELSAVSAGAIYMNYGDVKGEVTADSHEKWIELNS